MPRKDILKGIKRIVVKIGTSTITERGVISEKRLSSFAADISTLRKKGYSVVIVTSGAISAGATALKMKRENLTIPQKQAMAAVGQTILMKEYRKTFLSLGYDVGQILLTEDDVNNRKRFLNVRHTFNTLLDLGVIPIVNENDSVATEEIRFGENDILSAHVANVIEAGLLILLSDIDGFCLDMNNPVPVDAVYDINDDIKKCAGGSGSVHGTGGMISKIRAAEIIMRSGEMMIIANGKLENVLSRVMKGENIGTVFLDKNRSLSSRKRWIAFNMKTKGKIKIDSGAVTAICERKKSLLSTGIIESEGTFVLGDAVEIFDENGKLIGKGIVNYNKNELKLIQGKRTDEIKKILGNDYYNEVINRDDLIIY